MIFRARSLMCLSVALVAAAAAAGCGAILGVNGDYVEVHDAAGRDGTTTGPDGTGSVDGGSPDAGPSDSSILDGAGGGDGGQILFSDDFEQAGCPGWSSEAVSRTLDTTSHAGAGSCRVCGVPSDAGDTPGIERRILNPTPGRYRFDAYARQPPGQSTPSQWTVQITFKPTSGSDFSSTQPFALSQAWTFGTVTLTSTQAGAEVVGKVKANLAPGECILVDDAVLVKEN